MAFPQVAAENGGIEAVATTSHTINLPASIASGDLLLAYFTANHIATITWPEGWVLPTNGDFNPGSGYRGQVRYRIADGTEGASITVTTSASVISAHQTYRITGWHGTTVPEVAAGSNTSGSNPDPPSLAPSWGAEDTLWFAAEVNNNGTEASGEATGFPANYTNGVSRSPGSGFSGSSLGVARRELNASSEDPGTFALASSQFHIAATVAVRPAAGGGGGGTVVPTPTFLTLGVGA